MNFHSLDQGSTFIHSEKVVQMNACPVENQRHLKKKKRQNTVSETELISSNIRSKSELPI